MEHLFFNSTDDIDSLAEAIGDLLGSTPDSGESSNVLNESYFEVVLFGTKIRLEENCYDYEDQYRFMISVKRNVLANAIVRDTDINSVARNIQHLLADNLGLDVVLEVNSSLETCTPNQ